MNHQQSYVSMVSASLMIILVLLLVSCRANGSTLLDGLHTWSITKPSPLTHLVTSGANNGDVLHYRIASNGHEYDLQLNRAHDLFHADYEEILIGANNEVIERRRAADVETSCYYRGHVIGIPNSSVAISTCNQHNDRSRRSLSASSMPSSSLSSRFNRFQHQSRASDYNDESSMASLTGVIMMDGQSPIYIEPAHDHINGLQSYSSGDHITYRGSDIKSPSIGSCGVDHIIDGDHHDHKHSAAHATSAAGVTSPSTLSVPNHLTHDNAAPSSSSNSRFSTMANGDVQKYVTLYVVNDHKRYVQRGADTPNLSKQIVNQVVALYTNPSAMRFAYRIQIQLIGMATFSMADPYNAPSSTSATEIDHAELLSKFSGWRTAAIGVSLPAHDNAHLLSGYDFTGDTVGFAGVRAMCSTNSTGITQATSSNPIQTASTVAHEMGHNFGMRHDNQYGIISSVPLSFMNTWCNNNVSSVHQIMSAVSNAAIIPTIWSNCSQLYIDDWMAGGSYDRYGGSENPMCLETSSSTTWTNATTCGDGLRTGNEQCDCGLQDCAVVDPCCNQATCQLLAGKECSLMDPCCTPTCTIATDGRQCRASADSLCDAAEQCDGVLATCPSDWWASPGTSCTWNVTGVTGSGVCYAKSCLSHKQQCLVVAAALPSYGITDSCISDNGGNPACSSSLSCAVIGGCYYDMYIGSGMVNVLDGTPCGTNQQCYGSACVATSTLPVAVTDASWRLGNWSTCSHPCGGTYTRTVACKRGANMTVPDSWCVQPAPSTQSACLNATACSARVAWNISSSWSACSATCSGEMTRSVVCIDTISAGVVWPDSSCASFTKPNSTLPCNTNITCPYVSSSSGQQVTTSSSTGDGLEEVISTLNKELFSGFKVMHLLIVIAVLLVLMCVLALIRSCCCTASQRRVHDSHQFRQHKTAH